MIKISSRLPDVGTSIFTVMSKMALDHGAINLSQGFPDFSIDRKIIDLVHRYMLEDHNQYAPMPGAVALRQAIAGVIQKTYGHAVDADTEITVTPGATEAIFSIIAAFIHAGDEVLLFDPSYDSYDPAIRLNGGVPVHLHLRQPDFSIDWDDVRSRITKRTRMIMINTPHNPTGAVLTEHDLRTLESIALEHNLLVLSDEVYERLIYDGVAHQSVLRYPALAAQSLAVFSFGKTFHATGWKVGYAVGPAALMSEVRKAHQFIAFSVNTPVQLALAEYLKTPEHYETLGNFYQQKRDFFLDQIKGSSFEPRACRGSYFQLVSYRNISSQPDVAMAEELTKKFKVAAIPVSVFYHDKTDNRLLRFCFAKKEETLAQACNILRKL
ncbi:methionine aminotransferase [Chryseolinea lacunae]|uniref:Aminotransferase class I/II-fold pyridoxal phosphate-dependent enzyme n=1 Tax=Chryseolinea lacunae TaxID=2801331 RepID=A0ABS1KQP7_9BACT|nr:methionine aminotransferase [Chryseolinea lacunae]MBL0741523.1 aminotransferase class I/II-fold pyridoxal phosphate-dependent enzyme [Chryseolinea lacunae]